MIIFKFSALALLVMESGNPFTDDFCELLLQHHVVSAI